MFLRIQEEERQKAESAVRIANETINETTAKEQETTAKGQETTTKEQETTAKEQKTTVKGQKTTAKERKLLSEHKRQYGICWNKAQLTTIF